MIEHRGGNERDQQFLMASTDRQFVNRPIRIDTGRSGLSLFFGILENSAELVGQAAVPTLTFRVYDLVGESIEVVL